MKKKNILLLSIICLISLVIFSGLVVYAFDLQIKRDSLSMDNGQEDITGIEDTALNDTDSADTASIGTDSEKLITEDVDLESNDTVSTTNSDSSLENTVSEDIVSVKVRTEPIILGFVGDINFDEASNPVARYDKEQKGILGGISSDLVAEMNAADVMMLNNEFTYSSRGTKTPDKSYTFRANPSRVGILSEMGVDIVSLANNHTLDYGPDALLDTFQALDDAGIDYIGAGENMDRAKEPIYYTVDGTKIAYVAASRVVFSMDWYATDTRLGMIGTYDPTLFLTSIEEAAANSDYVVVFVHWGIEKNNIPEKYQRTLAMNYIDSGADAVIGCHPHVLQGFEYYKGKPIAYSLGNFWFSNSKRDSGLLKLYLDADNAVRVQLLPVMSENTYTSMMTKKLERKTYFDFMKEISYGVTIDEDGFVTEEN